MDFQWNLILTNLPLEHNLDILTVQIWIFIQFIGLTNLKKAIKAAFLVTIPVMLGYISVGIASVFFSFFNSKVILLAITKIRMD